jgi:hypothetical protein
MVKPSVIRFFSLSNEKKRIKTLALKGVNDLRKDFRLITRVLTEVISAIIPPSRFPYTILIMTVPAPLHKTISRQTSSIISPSNGTQ